MDISKSGASFICSQCDQTNGFFFVDGAEKHRSSSPYRASLTSPSVNSPSNRSSPSNVGPGLGPLPLPHSDQSLQAFIADNYWNALASFPGFSLSGHPSPAQQPAGFGPNSPNLSSLMSNSPAHSAFAHLRDKCMPNLANTPFASLPFHSSSMESLFANSLQQSVNSGASPAHSATANAFNEALSLYLPGATSGNNGNAPLSDSCKSHDSPLMSSNQHSKKENSAAFSGMSANNGGNGGGSKSNNSSNSSSSGNSKVESIVTCQSMFTHYYLCPP